jgi:membrane-associated phospholipid phosphatase
MKNICTFEQLESRKLFAVGWHNGDFPCDVDGSGYVTPLDALIVINDLNRNGTRAINDQETASAAVDVNADAFVTPLDALLIINILNKYSGRLELSSNVVQGDPDGNGVVLESYLVVGGQTSPDSDVKVMNETETVATGRSDSLGAFSLDVPVQVGSNLLEVRATDPLGRAIVQKIVVNRGDLVHNWNASALNVIRAWTAISNDPYQGRIVPSQPPMVARNLAMIHTALYDAANAAVGSYQPYLKNLSSPTSGTSATAAAASAAHTVASALYADADERAIWDATLHESLQLETDTVARDLGIDFGKLVGQAMLTDRIADGARSSVAYTPGTSPGAWGRTSPDFLPPLLPQWPKVKPFAITSVEALRPGPPPTLDSQSYAEAVDQVMRLGGLASTERTAEQTEIALFWADGGGTATPPGHWNRIATDASMTKGLSLVESARLFSMLNIAMADAGIASWDAKYTYNIWRPIDAIREANTDGNDLTTADLNWMPLLKTPPFPSYTSGHSTFSGAASAVLTALLGEDVSFESTTDPQNAPSQRPLAEDKIVTRFFTSFTQAAEEAGQSRIYGGIHFDFDNAAGLSVGRAVGTIVSETQLKLGKSP